MSSKFCVNIRVDAIQFMGLYVKVVHGKYSSTF
jgi:hypothetical protein